jgi:hypothetical protein
LSLYVRGNNPRYALCAPESVWTLRRREKSLASAGNGTLIVDIDFMLETLSLNYGVSVLITKPIIIILKMQKPCS